MSGSLNPNLPEKGRQCDFGIYMVFTEEDEGAEVWTLPIPPSPPSPEKNEKGGPEVSPPIPSPKE
jgi:hypothetical protein